MYTTISTALVAATLLANVELGQCSLRRQRLAPAFHDNGPSLIEAQGMRFQPELSVDTAALTPRPRTVTTTMVITKGMMPSGNLTHADSRICSLQGGEPGSKSALRFY